MTITRRHFGRGLAAALPFATACAQDKPDWGGPVVDCHHHLRRTPEANIVHLDGCGVSNAMALTRPNAADDIKALQTQYPGRILGWFAGADITKPDAGEILTKAVKAGAIGFGELKFHVDAAGPEVQRMYG